MNKTVDDIIIQYYAEVSEGLSNEKTPSKLNRGEGTEADYYILKIDLCDSTLFFLRRSSQTYFKIAHVFLSAIDEITRKFGSDTDQVEYAGDSVVAYFPNYHGMALNVLKAAYFTRDATVKMKSLDPTFSKFPFKTRIIAHYGKLILGKIGPWGDHNLTAIGMPLHKVAKLEKHVKPDTGLATKEFAEKLALVERRTFLIGNYSENSVEIPAPQSPSYNGTEINNAINALAGYNIAYKPPPLSVQPRYEVKKELINYNINWLKLKMLAEGRLRL